MKPAKPEKTEPIAQGGIKEALSIEGALQRFGDALQTREGRAQLIRGILRFIRRVLLAVALLYLLPLLIVTAGIHWWAEKNIALAFFSYLPAHLWILPAPFLLLVTLPFSWRIAGLYLVSMLLFFFGFMDYQGAPEKHSAANGSPALSVLSYNRGQHLNQSLQPFKNAVEPDILTLQESFGRAPRYAKAPEYTEFSHADGAGEFVLLSKHPILDARLLSFEAWGREQKIAARFEIDFKGQKIAVYSVHMPTVRDILTYYRRGAFLYGVLGVPGTSLGTKRKENQKYWDARIALARELADAMAAEEIPCLAVGDFNMPDHGSIYGRFSSVMSDAHEEAGGGFGYTFPGTTRNPLTLWGPWLRLDYAFASDHWSVLEFATERDRTSQHRAVYAKFALDAAR